MPQGDWNQYALKTCMNQLYYIQNIPAPPCVVESFCGGVVRVKCELFPIQAQDLAPTNGYLKQLHVLKLNSYTAWTPLQLSLWWILVQVGSWWHWNRCEQSDTEGAQGNLKINLKEKFHWKYIDEFAFRSSFFMNINFSCYVNTDTCLVEDIQIDLTCFDIKFVHQFVKAIIQGQSRDVD